MIKNALFSTAVKLIGLLPVSVSRFMAKRLVTVLTKIGIREVNIAETNTALCFPELSAEEAKNFVKDTLKQNAMTLLEMPAVWQKPPDFWLQRIQEGDTDKKIKQLLDLKKGVIVAIPHIGNWELSSHYLPQFGNGVGLYRPPRQAGIEKTIIKGRSAAGGTLVPTTPSGIKTLISTLRKGEIVVILPDQQPKKEGSTAVFAPFFGVQALTMSLLNKLAARTGAPVLVTAFLRQQNSQNFRIESFQAGPDIANKDSLIAATELNHCIEKIIRIAPTQYQWTYRRFSSQPNGQPDPYLVRKNK